MVLPHIKVPDQLRKKWHRRSEPMLSVKNKLQEQQQNENKHIVENTTDTNRNSNSNNEKKEEKDLTTKTKKDLNPDLCVFGIGDYQFISLLGKGKFSEVMLAQHYLTGEKFAIKIIDKRSYDERILIRLIREIRIMEVLNHPNIVRIYETIETAYTIYMVMEYISGGNLEEYLKKKGGYLNEQEARAIFRQMISAIDYCHRKWVVHRDIKAQNVLLTENNQIRIVDFGLSNRFGYNRLQTVCGSVFYYSPEMINRKKYIGPEIDCWCLGIFLYRMTAGTEAFANAKSEEELRRDIVNRNYKTPDYFSEGLKHTIQKCLSTDRRRRSSLCNALQGDPWLNDYGRLGDLFTDASNYHAAMYQFSAPPSHQYNNTPDTTATGINRMDDIALEIRQKEREQQQQQFLRDIEEEKRTVFQIRKNIIYHAYNKSNYYYTLHGKRDDSMTLESARSKLYQDIRSVLNQVSLESVDIANILNAKSPVQNLFQKLRRSESHANLLVSSPFSSSANTTTTPSPPSFATTKLLSSSSSSSSSLSSLSSNEDSTLQQQSKRSSVTSRFMNLSKKSSTLTLSQIYQKNSNNNNNNNNNNNKEKIFYFTIQSNVRALSSATILSLNSSHTATTTLLDDQRVPTTGQPDQTQDEFELTLLVRSICELLGVTYLHETKSKLCCMLALEDIVLPTTTTTINHHNQQQKQQLKKMASTNTIGLYSTKDSQSKSSPSPNLLKKKQSFSFHPSSPSMDFNNNNNKDHCTSHPPSPHRWLNRQLNRFSLRHTKSVQNLKSAMPLTAKNNNDIKLMNDEPLMKEKDQETIGAIYNNNTSNINKETIANGLALFIAEVTFIPSKQNDARLLALKFTKVSGSARIYELATGWITRILRSKND